MSPLQHRVQFDFDIEFTNGGGIQGQGFRLDIAGEDITDAELVDYLVRDMRLLMVGQARILSEIYAPGTEFHIASIEMVANTGTYLDCPFHRYEHGRDLSQITPDAFADLEGIVVRADHREARAIDAACFRDKEVRGRAVLVHTGWDAY